MNFSIIFKILFTVLLVCQVSLAFTLKFKRNAPEEKNLCMNNNACGWQIEKKDGRFEYVENSCRCRSDERCYRSLKDYRLDGYKYNCKKYQASIFSEGDEFPYPKNNTNNQPNIGPDD